MEPIHPKIVHFPIALSMILPLLGGILTLAWWRGWLPRRVWLIVMILHGALTISAFVAMQTGETDERTAKNAVSIDLIRAHESSAELFLWSTVGALFLALIATVAEKEQEALRFAIGTVLFASLSLYLAIDVGHQGGQLVYKHGAARAFINTQSDQSPSSSSPSSEAKTTDIR